MNKNILIIDAHPDGGSFCANIALQYYNASAEAGFNTKMISLRDLSFNMNLSGGYRIPTPLEADLIMAGQEIKKADHIVWIYPNWWGTFPALLKGFIDRVFLPGFAFKYRENSILWDKLLIGKTAQLIVTMDTPSWFYRFVYHSPGHNAMKRSLLKFCGFKSVKSKIFSPVKNSADATRQKWIGEVTRMASREK